MFRGKLGIETEQSRDIATVIHIKSSSSRNVAEHGFVSSLTPKNQDHAEPVCMPFSRIEAQVKTIAQYEVT